VQLRSEAGPVLFDVEEMPSGFEPVAKGKTVIAELDTSIETALASVRPAAQAVIDTFKALTPDEVSVEFGLRLDAEAGVVIARTGISAHFTVSLKWSASHPVAPQDASTGD
jgi:hypothetical protein